MSENQQAVYGNRFFKRRFEVYHEREVVLGRLIFDYFKPKSVIDVGCGIGSYLWAMDALGALVTGIEYGAKYAKRYALPPVNEYIHQGDASQPLSLNITADLVMCIEVAEHIKPESSMILVRNLCNLSAQYILFTAAAPRARGTGHINCRPLGDWSGMFSSLGHYVNPVMTGDMQKLFNGVGDPLHLSKNLLVLSKK